MRRTLGIALILIFALFHASKSLAAGDQWISLEYPGHFSISLPPKSKHIRGSAPEDCFLYCSLENKGITFLLSPTSYPLMVHLYNSQEVKKGQIIDGGNGEARLVMERKNARVNGHNLVIVKYYLYDFIKQQNTIVISELVMVSDELYGITCMTKACSTQNQAQNIMKMNKELIQKFFNRIKFY